MSVSLGFVHPAPQGQSHPAQYLYRRLNDLLAPAGVVLNGSNPWDPQIHRTSAVIRTLFHGTLGAGESYVDGDWDCDALDVFTARLLGAEADRPLAWRSLTAIVNELVARVTNPQTRDRSKTGVSSHYDIGNDLYAAMLGPTMTYSCGYWAHSSTLDAAQRAKHDLVCRKLGLRAGQQVLDIGCGWGGFAEHAAAHYGVTVTGITISSEQAKLARLRCAGLPVSIHEVDYRDVTGAFDRVVSIGMFEHVGPNNYATYFDAMRRLVHSDGLCLLHTIGGLASTRSSDAWIAKYIFPGAVLPSAAEITRAAEGRFVIEDWDNFGADYDRTLMAWHARFNDAWPALSNRYGERFGRLFRYYLLTCAGTFRARRNQVWQIVLSPHGVPGGYSRTAAATST
jgi:cyclopropane-fatty-acyl-phospholipid synthase